MTSYAVFLRAVNLGSHNKIAMPAFRAAVESLGWRGVETYVQSGNLVADAGSLRAAAVEQQIGEILRADFGVDTDVIARTKAQLAKVAKQNPFTSQASADPTSVHVHFLAESPPASAKRAFDPEQFDPERFEFGDRCVYFFYPGGQGRSKMAAAPWAKKLGVPGTSRNWRTVLAMLDLMAAG